MSNYLPDYKKKARIFARREQELRHAIRHNFTAEKLLLAAAKVRAAKIAVYKSRFAQHSTQQRHGFRLEKAAQHDKNLQHWLSMTTNEIVDSYRITR